MNRRHLNARPVPHWVLALCVSTLLGACGGGGDDSVSAEAQGQVEFTSTVPDQADGTLSESSAPVAQALVRQANQASIDLGIRMPSTGEALSAGLASPRVQAGGATEDVSYFCRPGGRATMSASRSQLDRYNRGGGPVVGEKLLYSFDACVLQQGEVFGGGMPIGTLLNGYVFLDFVAVNPQPREVAQTVTYVDFKASWGEIVSGPWTYQISMGLNDEGQPHIFSFDTGVARYLHPVNGSVGSTREAVIASGTGRVQVPGQTGYFDFVFNNWTVNAVGDAVAGDVTVIGADGLVQAQLIAGQAQGQVSVTIQQNTPIIVPAQGGLGSQAIR